MQPYVYSGAGGTWITSRYGGDYEGVYEGHRDRVINADDHNAWKTLSIASR